jgi:formylglycine-generating enzyme required for sulfatase activity
MSVAVAASSICSGVTAQSTAVQWTVASGGNGHWYELVISRSITWPSAKDACEQRGGHLVTPTTPTENALVTQLGNRADHPTAWVDDFGGNAQGPWLGGYQPIDAQIAQPWAWVTGEPWTWAGWAPGEPNGGYGPGVTFTGMLGYANSNYYRGWFDGVTTDYSTYPLPLSYIIEWSADCNSDNIVDYGQILSGQLADTNTNGIPDICECATHPELGACRCVGDIVTDGVVNGADLGTLLAYWGLTTSAPYSQASDINVDGRVDGADLGRLLSNWGACQYSGVTVPAWATLIEALPDPAVVTDPALRTAIAATGLAWRVRDTGTGIEMLLVPQGTFQMGCSQRSDSFPCVEWELPVHAVTITKPFYLGRHEVTQQQWGASMGSNPSTFQGRVDSDWRPVETVSWNAVQPYLAATNMRLPTEAEWEYACRAGTTTAFSNGSNDDSTIGSIAWWGSCCGGNSGGETRPVGTKPGNALGLNDMLGNVWEWVSDWFANYPTDAQVDPLGPTSGQLKPLRGGSWADDTHYVHSSYRYEAATPYNAYPQAGFRVARNP